MDLMIMNKSDIKLILIVLIVFVILFLGFRLLKNDGLKNANVYYKDELVLTIDLSINQLQSFSVVGDNGLVNIEAKNGKVRVVSEISPLHICSNQGWVDSVYTPIVCLPNSVVIKIVNSDTNQLDAVVE